MARKLIFDPTERDEFVESWQRLDYMLLQNGFVHRVADSGLLSRAGRRLADLGYLVHEIDAADWASEADLHAGLAGTLSFPDYYGRNLDALNDVLGDIAQFEYGSDSTSTGTVVVIDHYDQVHGFDERLAAVVADIFALRAQHGALLGHPMMLLLGCRADLGRLGGARASDITAYLE